MSTTITQGYSFGSTELVTNTKLTLLITGATLSGISGSEIALSDFIFYEGDIVSYDDELVSL